MQYCFLLKKLTGNIKGRNLSKLLIKQYFEMAVEIISYVRSYKHNIPLELLNSVFSVHCVQVFSPASFADSQYIKFALRLCSTSQAFKFEMDAEQIYVLHHKTVSCRFVFAAQNVYACHSHSYNLIRHAPPRAFKSLKLHTEDQRRLLRIRVLHTQQSARRSCDLLMINE